MRERVRGRVREIVGERGERESEREREGERGRREIERERAGDGEGGERE